MAKKKLIRLTESDLLNIIKSCAARFINESLEDHIFYDYIEEYGPYYVFNQFLSNPKGKQEWEPLINADMYAKALREFTQYGRFVHFPGKYVYQWMGIIMRNTAILLSNTDIAGHSQHFPFEEFEDFLISWYGRDRYIKVNYNQNVVIQLNPQEVTKLCDDGVLFEAVDKIKDNKEKAETFKKEYPDLLDEIEKYNQKNKNRERYIEINYENQSFLWHSDIFDVLDCVGFYDWMVMPDGSDAFSDYGLDPLYNIIEDYNEDLSPEEVLVLVNKALDVYHQRGDMSSIFIQGGSKTLSKIAENIKRKGVVMKG